MYELADEEDTAMFRIDLAILVECLTIFDCCTSSLGTTTALKMMYEGYGQPLRIMYVSADIDEHNSTNENLDTN